MAITTNAICNSFKKQLLEATHNFSNPGGNSFKLAMYTNSATLGKSTTSFTTGKMKIVLMSQVPIFKFSCYSINTLCMNCIYGNQ